MLKFERLLGRRYLLRAQRKFKVFYWGLFFVALAIVLFFLRTYLESHISDLTNYSDFSWAANDPKIPKEDSFSWDIKLLRNVIGIGFEAQLKLRDIAQIVQVGAVSSMAIGICLSLFGVLYAFLTTFSAFSTFMVSMGVAEVILVLGVMNGFQGFLRQKLLDANAHITLEPVDDDWLGHYQQIAQEAKGIEGVLGVNPIIEAEVMLKIPSQDTASAAMLIGIDPNQAEQTIFLQQFLKAGCGCLAYIAQPKIFHDRYAKNPLLQLDLDTDQNDKFTAEDNICQSCPALSTLQGDQKLDQEKKELTTPSLMSFPSPIKQQVEPVILLGSNLRYHLGLNLGQKLEVISHLGEIGPDGPMPRIKSFTMAGFLNSGLVEVDTHQAYTSLQSLQKFMGVGDVVSVIQIRAKDIESAVLVKERLKQHFQGRVMVKDWQEKNQGLFSALQLERIAMFLVLTINILLSAFSITSTLVMTILERKREIAILKAMGATRSSILNIFMNQGITTGFVGVSLGCLVGVGGSYLISSMALPSNVQDLYFITSIPVDVKLFDVLSIVFVAFFVSLASTLYPAYYASGIEPLEGLKGK